MSTEVSNSLMDLAERIRDAHENVRRALKRAVDLAMMAGDLLIEAKAQLDHGQWTPWLREHCEISERTARLYMQLAKGREVIEKYEDTVNLTLNAAVQLLASPKDKYLEEKVAEIKALYNKAKGNVAELQEHLIIAKATFEDEAKWLEWLQQVFPDATEPCDKELSELFGEIVLEMAGIGPEDEN